MLAKEFIEILLHTAGENLQGFHVIGFTSDGEWWNIHDDEEVPDIDRIGILFNRSEIKEGR